MSILQSNKVIAIEEHYIDPNVTKLQEANTTNTRIRNPKMVSRMEDFGGERIEEMDGEIDSFISKIKSFNPEAMAEMKKVFWQGTEHWDTLLLERAQVSGTLVLSDFTRNAINIFKKK